MATVTGSQKLVQDLRCALLEPMGTDDLHPDFGSLIDGGRRSDGVPVPSPLGGMDWSRIALQVKSEIQRVAEAHQRRQVVRARNDQLVYRKPTLGPGELLLGITDIQMTQVQSTLLIQVTLSVGDGSQRTINIPITNSPITTS